VTDKKGDRESVILSDSEESHPFFHSRDFSIREFLRCPFADPSYKLRASAQGFGSGQRLRGFTPSE